MPKSWLIFVASTDKLRIVKPLEGSLTLHQWQRLAVPHLGNILEERAGVAVKGDESNAAAAAIGRRKPKVRLSFNIEGGKEREREKDGEVEKRREREIERDWPIVRLKEKEREREI
jgi:hypothetical protein